MRDTGGSRPGLAFLALLLSQAFSVLGYESLHLVDLQQVMCPGQQGYYDVDLDMTQLSANAYDPHVVTFLRSSNQLTTVVFSVLSGDGTPWSQGNMSITLDYISGRRLSPDDFSDAVDESSGESRDGDGSSEESRDGDGDLLDETTAEEGLERRLSVDRRRSPSPSPPPRRRRSPPPRRRRSPPPRRRSPPPRRRRSPPPRRRRSPSPPRRRRSPSPPPRRRGVAPPRRRAFTASPRRRRLVTPRRRGSPPRRRGVPRRRQYAVGPPNQPYNRFSSTSTGGNGYGYTNQQSMYNRYNGGYPGATPYGYSGVSSYGSTSSGRSNALVYAGAGFVGGAVVGAGSYYMYNRMTRQTCVGYSCCYGCGTGSCYSQSRTACQSSMTQKYYQDDIMVEGGFYPNDLQPPIKVRISQVIGSGYSEAAICPPEDCDENSNLSDSDCSVNASALVASDLFVTLTQMDELTDDDGTASGAELTGGPSLLAIVFAILVLVSILKK